jgi:hypothetical protein
MKKIGYFLIGAFLFVQVACKDRSTVIEGYITDKVTGAPIEGAALDYLIKYGTDPGSRQESTYSDASGFYSITVPPNSRWDIYSVFKEGYLQKISPVMGHYFESGKVNTLNVELIPRDGVIRLIANNSIPGNDTLYVGFFSQLTEDEFQLSGYSYSERYPIVLTPNATYEEIINLTSEEMIRIFWRAYPLPTQKDSVFLHRLDTLLYTINF